MWFYRLLLLLCPASFRNEYAGEIQALFAKRYQNARGFGALWLWMEAITDLALAGASAHLDLLGQDLRYAWRGALRRPGFTLAVAGVSALGVAAATSVFSVADHVLLRELPYRDSSKLVKLWQDQTAKGYPRMDVSPANYRDWRAMNHSFSAMAAYREVSANLSGAGDPERLIGSAISADLFPALGVQPALGRVFTAREDQPDSPSTVILSYNLWQRRFAGDPAVLGQTVIFDGDPATIIGVMPPDFYFPRREVQIWRTLRFDNDDYVDRRNCYLEVVARLKPGVSFSQAAAELRGIGQNLERQYPQENEKSGISLYTLRDQLSRRAQTTLIVLGCCALFLLLIACSNLANLLLAKGAARARELAVRAALGAARERLIRQLLTESALLAAIGGLAGTALAYVIVPLLSRLVPSRLPIAEVPAMDWRVLLFALTVTIVTGTAFGVLPALRSTSASYGLRSASGQRRERLRRTLVVAQVAASLALMVCTGLLTRALTAIQSVQPGFATTGSLLFRTALPMPKYLNTSQRQTFYDTALNQIKALPGVRSASVVSFRPMGDFRGGIWGLVVPGRSDQPVAVSRFVLPDYFSTMRIPLKQGRDFTAADTANSTRVAVVSESFAQQMWPGQSAIGRTFGIVFGNLKFVVVGVAGNVRFRGLESDSEPQMYFAHSQMPDSSFVWFVPKDFVVATTLPPATLVPAIRRIIGGIDPTQPVSDIQTVSDLVEAETSGRRTQLWVIGAFALAAFLLAAVGIHGLLSFAVVQRTQEIGVRRALGARGGQIASLVFGEAFLLAFLGLLTGGAAAYLLGRWMESILVGVQPADPVTLAQSAGLALLMTLLGALIPALRAIAIDPASALRGE
jgi:putative ABC transport system permease protein